MRKIALAAVALSLFVAPALAGPKEDAVAARQGHYKLLGANMGALAAMAKGEVDYDAKKAQVHADNLALLSKNNIGFLFVQEPLQPICPARPARKQKSGKTSQQSAQLQLSLLKRSQAYRPKLAKGAVNWVQPSALLVRLAKIATNHSAKNRHSKGPNISFGPFFSKANGP